MSVIPPGKTIGILGGGQLGRMTAQAAQRLGYQVRIYCPSSEEPALQVTSLHTLGAYDDAKALRNFATSVDVVTIEWENLPAGALQAIEVLGRAVHPSSEVLQVAQDRVAEKSFAQQHGVGTASFAAVSHLDELRAAAKKIGLPAMLKTTRMGYDGKGQILLRPGADLLQAWQDIGGVPCILEGFIDFAMEISVIVARSAAGEVKCFPPVQNIHRDQILAETHAPADIDALIAREAMQVAETLAEKLNVIGLLAIEMFVLREPNAEGKRVLMNEIAPRPHNSGHWTMDACATSQFEQLIRAICGLPLGNPQPHSKAVMYNLLGGEAERWGEWLGKKNACLHLYGKGEARPGRKMGHVTVLEDKN